MKSGASKSQPNVRINSEAQLYFESTAPSKLPRISLHADSRRVFLETKKNETSESTT
jgi:hypothetical protein